MEGAMHETASAMGFPGRGWKTKIEARASRCNTCNKWRRMEEEKDYETVQAQAREVPFVCEWGRKRGRDMTCEDEEDASPEVDGILVWGSIPVTPANRSRRAEIHAPGSDKFRRRYGRGRCECVLEYATGVPAGTSTESNSPDHRTSASQLPNASIPINHSRASFISFHKYINLSLFTLLPVSVTVTVCIACLDLDICNISLALLSLHWACTPCCLLIN